MSKERSERDWRDEQERRARSKSIYRDSRDMIQEEAVRQIRKGDLTGAERGVFHAGLAACALGAESTAEALPFARQLARETGEPGWFMAQAALSADSPVFLEALIELGRFDPLTEPVWSGYRNQDGEPTRDALCAEDATRRGSARCLRALLARVPSDGLLSAAVESRHPETFALLLDRAVSAGRLDEINAAFAKLCSLANERESSGLLGGGEMARALLEAGASLSFDAGSPAGWRSWNGSSPNAIETAWAPALRLAESEEELPEGGRLSGEMDGGLFFSHWSSACLLARCAVEGGRGEGAERLLREQPGWALAKAEASDIAPIALMAMADPSTTDSGLRRETLNVAQFILSCPDLPAALRQSGPFSLAKAAVGKWLWGARASAPKPGEKAPWRPDGMAPDALVEGLSKASVELGARPLGPNGSLAAAQEFVARLRVFGESTYQASFARAGEGKEEREARLAEEERRYDEFVAAERRAADHLAALMPPGFAQRFVEAVEAAHARRKIADPTERSVQKESLILGLISAEPGLSLRPRL